MDNTLADELINANAILLAVPFYNWGIPAHVKSWFDVTDTDARIRSGALAGKPVVLSTVLGGDYSEESGKADWDHSTDTVTDFMGAVSRFAGTYLCLTPCHAA